MPLSARKTVAVLEPGYADYAVERGILAPCAATVTAIAEDEAAVPALEKLDPVAVLVRERRVGAEHIAACPNLSVIVRYGIGVDNVDLAAATERGIYVANVPDYGAENEVSDHAVALYLAVARRIVNRDREVREAKWNVGQAQPVTGHRGGVLGLVGFGRIARVACVKFRALGFERVLVHDPYVEPEQLSAANVEGVDMETLCREADLVSIHAPLTAETHHILGRDRIALMKPTAIVVNVARGGLIDETALAESLKAGRLFGAGLDVFEAEPPQRSHPLLAAPNTVLSDHTAWYSEQSVGLLQSKAAEEVRRVLEGGTPQNWVNRWPG